MFTHSYVQELENLVLEELLPVYERWHREHGVPPSYSNIHPNLLQQIKRKKHIAALFKPPKLKT